MQVLPELKSILATAQAAQLLEILRAVPQLQRAMRVDQIEDTLVPVLLRGLAQADTRIQEEVLSSFKLPMQKIGGACLHGLVLPELMKACMRTKSGAVRCGALLILVDAASRLTEAESNAIVRMVAKIASVDKSPSTLQHVLKVRWQCAQDVWVGLMVGVGHSFCQAHNVRFHARSNLLTPPNSRMAQMGV